MANLLGHVTMSWCRMCHTIFQLAAFIWLSHISDLIDEKNISCDISLVLTESHVMYQGNVTDH